MNTLQAAARAVGMHPRTLRRWIADGRVEATKARGRNGQAWFFDRAQLDALRTAAARDVEPVIEAANVADVAEQLEPDNAQQLAPATTAAQPLDLAGLVAAVASTVAGARADAAADTAASYRAQLDAERQAHAAIVAAMRRELDAERRRADDAADATAHARALLEDARGLVAAQAATIAAMQQRAATTATRSTRSTQPLDRGALRSIAGGV